MNTNRFIEELYSLKILSIEASKLYSTFFERVNKTFNYHYGRDYRVSQNLPQICTASA